MTVKYKWDDRNYVRVYQLSKIGLSRKLIAEELGIPVRIFERWIEKKPALLHALKEGEKKESVQAEYIYGLLSEKAKRVWDQLDDLKKEKNAVRKIELLFDKEGEGIRKQLFVHALASFHFNPTQACKKVGISYSKFKSWVETDYEFAQLVDEMQEHKGNMYEAALTELAIVDKEPAAIIHVNKTFNRQRGYGDKLEIEHTGTVRNEHVLELSEELLDRLSIPARKELVMVMDQMQADQKQLEVVK